MSVDVAESIAGTRRRCVKALQLRGSRLAQDGGRERQNVPGGRRTGRRRDSDSRAGNMHNCEIWFSLHMTSSAFHTIHRSDAPTRDGQHVISRRNYLVRGTTLT